MRAKTVIVLKGIHCLKTTSGFGKASLTKSFIFLNLPANWGKPEPECWTILFQNDNLVTLPESRMERMCLNKGTVSAVKVGGYRYLDSNLETSSPESVEHGESRPGDLIKYNVMFMVMVSLWGVLCIMDVRT